MVWEDVEFLGDVGSRLKHVLNTRPVHRLSNLLSPSLSTSPKDTMRRMQEYFDVEGDRKEFVMAQKIVPCASARTTPFSDGKPKVIIGEATTVTTTHLLFPADFASNVEDISDDDSLFFPCYDHLPSTKAVIPTATPDLTFDICPSPTLCADTTKDHERFICFSNDTVDDTYLQHPPTQHVDYLSHDWREEDLSASWRFNMSNRLAPAGDELNRSRLLNASWRRWGMARHNLATLPAEEIDWIKDDDVTWLYGPIQIQRNALSLDPPRRALSLDLVAPPNFTPSLRHNSILRIPTLEEVVLRRSSLELASNRYLPPSSLESSRSSLSSCNISAKSSSNNLLSLGASSSSSDSGLYISPLAPGPTPRPKKVSFHSEVAQARKVFTHRDSDERVMTEDELELSRNISRERPRQTSEPLIHEPIDPAQLKKPGEVYPSPGESCRNGPSGGSSSFFPQRSRPGNVLPTADTPNRGLSLNTEIAGSKVLAKNVLAKETDHKFVGTKAVISRKASRGRERANSLANSAAEHVGSLVGSLSLGSSQSPTEPKTSDEVVVEPGSGAPNHEPSEPGNQQSVVAPSAQNLRSETNPDALHPSKHCRVMSVKLPPTPQIHILSEEDLFEIEMFGQPLPPPRTTTNQVHVTRTDTASSITFDSFDNYEEFEYAQSAYDTADIEEKDNEMHAVANKFFTQHEAYASSVIKDQPRYVVPSCSTEARNGNFNGKFAVQMPMVASPISMDDEEDYWFMNV